MNCQFRTIRAGSAALGLSVVVASVTWQSVLLLFMATGVGFSLWSWLKERSRHANDQNAGESIDEKVRSRDINAKVYQFRYQMPAALSQRK